MSADQCLSGMAMIKVMREVRSLVETPPEGIKVSTAATVAAAASHSWAQRQRVANQPATSSLPWRSQCSERDQSRAWAATFDCTLPTWRACEADELAFECWLSDSGPGSRLCNI